MFFHVLFLCLYLCTRASGGLILIARQASKCLCHCVLFFASDITDWYTVQLCMAINHKQICYWLLQTKFSVRYYLLSCILTSHVSLLLQDVWLCGEADGQCYRERVSPVCRDGPRAASCSHCQLYQQSHAGTTDTQMREQENLTTLDYLGIWGRC